MSDWQTKGQDTKRKPEPSVNANNDGERLMRDFGKANVLQGYTEGEAGAGKHRRNRLKKLSEPFSECSTTWAPVLPSHVPQGTNPI